MSTEYLQIKRILIHKLENVCMRSKIPIEDAVEIAIKNYVDEEELRFRMEDDYEAGIFAA